MVDSNAMVWQLDYMQTWMGKTPAHLPCYCWWWRGSIDNGCALASGGWESFGTTKSVVSIPGLVWNCIAASESRCSCTVDLKPDSTHGAYRIFSFFMVCTIPDQLPVGYYTMHIMIGSLNGD